MRPTDTPEPWTIRAAEIFEFQRDCITAAIPVKPLEETRIFYGLRFTAAFLFPEGVQDISHAQSFSDQW